MRLTNHYHNLHMPLPRSFLIASLLTLVSLFCYADSTEPPSTADIYLEYEDNLLTLRAKNATLQQIVKLLGEKIGFDTFFTSKEVQFPSINPNYEKMPVHDALQKLLAGTNRIVVYGGENAPEDGQTNNTDIAQIWILGTAVTTKRAPNFVNSSDNNSAYKNSVARSKEILRLANHEYPEEVIDVLASVLQNEQDPLVRNRAALALGNLAHPQAILPLKTALTDEDFSVRTQAIHALGRVDHEQASVALGDVLLESKDSLERVMAINALAKHHNKTAMRLIQHASNDTDKQVQRASEMAVASSKQTNSSLPEKIHNKYTQ